ncbi:hypothetical protein QLQ12_14140 [Actinoplanes sp. NEAU-A12]|uniref:Uncharacterized protein n=1 Tax=Actinoplanes sandaracinus TaxID=3045177 RepID=A0ABT6WJ29_9ACTN|nr:hypothetical protein [Actinoplanes sandaracinus]MDI6099739.1 hypothetical protein [Actinoplanes sandaracinus]
MIPEEDLGPAWLRDYQYTDFGSIEADIQAMKQFAARLTASIEHSYAPHAVTVSETMINRLPDAPLGFYDLHIFLYAHDQVQIATQQNVYGYINNTYRFASAADQISEKYQGADAFSRAKIADVHATLGVTVPGVDAAGNSTGEV